MNARREEQTFDHSLDPDTAGASPHAKQVPTTADLPAQTISVNPSAKRDRVIE